MSTLLEMLEVEVLRLSPEDRARLLDRLIESLDDEKTLDAAWDAEAARRDADVVSGASVPVDGKEVVARIRAQAR